jgi:2',3'-cyclic-nucleotide 2'-phosphodiesterase (5'-nucleotidase family)
MAKLKKYNGAGGHFVLFLTFIVLFSCQSNKLWISKIEGKEIKLTAELREDSLIQTVIAPYKKAIDTDLSKVLAYAPTTIDKSGEWQTPLGSLLADLSFAKASSLFQEMQQQKLDLCILNSGGIRTILLKGDVTARNAYEIMPFENNLLVVALKGEQIMELLNYFIQEHKPHPISGLVFRISAESAPVDIKINGKDFDLNSTYYVATSDYLANGGDNMLFFKKELARYDLNYKLRTVLIDHFTQVDTLIAPKNERVFSQK